MHLLHMISDCLDVLVQEVVEEHERCLLQLNVAVRTGACAKFVEENTVVVALVTDRLAMREEFCAETGTSLVATSRDARIRVTSRTKA
jgi:hypothetical protein